MPGFFDDMADEIAAGLVRGFIMGLTGEREGRCMDCGRKIRYNVKKDGNGPFYCQSCYDKLQKQGGADLFYAELIPSGWESSVQRPEKTLGDKGIMLFKGKGTGGADYRVTWHGHGDDIHWTDQGLPDHHPRAHRDPRYE